jgi:hypothetical protein
MENETPILTKPLLPAVPVSEHKVALCWATKKRHIAVDGKVLCEPKHTTTGYSVKNGGYNSLSLSGIPTHFKISDDSKHTHGDGIIPFVPLEKQPFNIIRRSICTKCQKKYDALWHSR